MDSLYHSIFLVGHHLVLDTGPVRVLVSPSVRLLGYSGGFVLLCYAPFLAPPEAAVLPGLMVFWSFFCTGVIVLCDAASRLLADRSLLAGIGRDRRAFLDFLIAGTLSGLVLDGVAQWTGKLWIYPYWNNALYGSTFVLGFCSYWLLLVETYSVARLLLRPAFASAPGALPRWAPAAFGAGGCCGAALVIAGLALAAAACRSTGGCRFDIAAPRHTPVPFASCLLIFAGVWLLLEYVQHKRGRESLGAALLRGDWLPLAAVLAASWPFGVFMETVNTAQYFWRYTNWPLGSMVNVPALVLLLWPLQYPIFLGVHQSVSREPILEYCSRICGQDLKKEGGLF